jgi:hypothetical protein
MRDQADRYGKLFEQGIVSRDQGEQFASNADALSQLVLADNAASRRSVPERDGNSGERRWAALQNEE